MAAISFQVGMADEAVVVQQGQCVVAAHSLLRRHIDFPTVVEGPHGLCHPAVIDDGIERGEQQRLQSGFGSACGDFEHIRVAAQDMQAGSHLVLDAEGNRELDPAILAKAIKKVS